jgi:hypothetical protein
MEPRHIVFIFAYWRTFNIIRRHSPHVLQTSGVRVKDAGTIVHEVSMKFLWTGKVLGIKSLESFTAYSFKRLNGQNPMLAHYRTLFLIRRFKSIRKTPYTYLKRYIIPHSLCSPFPSKGHEMRKPVIFVAYSFCCKNFE